MCPSERFRYPTKVAQIMPDTTSSEVSAEDVTQSLIDMAVDSWRFSKVFEKALGMLDAGEQGRFRGQHRWFSKRIEESLTSIGLRVVNVEGQCFDPGIAATPLNIGDFSTDDLLIIDQMIEPIIMGRDGLVKSGTVTLRRADT